MADQGNLYQKLISAAKTALDQGHKMPATLSDLAVLAEVDEADVRSSFKSIDELHDGLIYQSVVLLNDALRRGLIGAGSQSPDAQLRSLARSYGEWAQNNPSLFALMVQGLNDPFQDDSALFRFTMSMRDLFSRKLQEMCDLGMLKKDTNIDGIILMLHCLVKGANVMFVARASDPWLRGETREITNMAGDIFDDFMDCVLAGHAPQSKEKVAAV